MFRRKRLRTPHLREARKRYITLVVLLCVTLFLSVIFFISQVSRLPVLQISSFSIRGNKVLDTGSVESLIKDRLGKFYFWVLIPRRNMLLYPKRAIASELLESYPRIDSVLLQLDSSRLIVRINEREPHGIYCRDESPSCYLVDDDGYIFADAPRFSGPVYFTYITPLEGNPIGQFVMGDAQYQAISIFAEELTHDGYGVIGVRETRSGYYEMLLEHDAKILFNRAEDYSETHATLTSATRAESYAEQVDEGKQLEYIDLRFGNKVYYRFYP